MTDGKIDVTPDGELEVHDTYLGDGVYASFDGWHIWLDLRMQDDARIALAPQTLRALDEFRAAIRVALAIAGDIKEERSKR